MKTDHPKYSDLKKIAAVVWVAMFFASIAIGAYIYYMFPIYIGIPLPEWITALSG